MDRLGPYDLNTIVVGDCLEVMAKMPDECVDLTVTSPPYDNLRTYKGYVFDFKPTAIELYRVTQAGGIVIWIVADATVNGSETGTSFRQALGFVEIGFNLHDTMIYRKLNVPCYDPRNKRYKSFFEYMFVVSKGTPSTYNPIRDKPTKKKRARGITKRNPDGSMRKPKDVSFGDFQDRENVWSYYTGYMQSAKDKAVFQHPAIFPEALAYDHIISWSNAGDLVFDPFIGSGTTAVAADRLGRKWFGCDISEEYVELALGRIAQDRERRAQMKLF